MDESAWLGPTIPDRTYYDQKYKTLRDELDDIEAELSEADRLRDLRFFELGDLA